MGQSFDQEFMSYTKYTTEAIILRSFNVGEADRYFSLFTKDIGLIQAQARGVRQLKSKQRYALQNMSLSQVSLVRGKSRWRITNAISRESAFASLDDKSMRAFARILKLLDRLIKGEEENKDLYILVYEGYTYIRDMNLTEKSIKSVEVLLVLRILENLGYLERNKFSELFRGEPFNGEKVVMTAHVLGKAVFEINESIKASQL